MSSKLVSNRVKVRNPQAVQELLDTRKLSGVEIKLSKRKGAWTLVMEYATDDLDDWEHPVALLLRDWPGEPPDDDDEYEKYTEVLDARHEQKGNEEFLQLLRDLALHIETPLLILLVIHYHDMSSEAAKVWVVLPGASDVLTLDVDVGR